MVELEIPLPPLEAEIAGRDHRVDESPNSARIHHGLALAKRAHVPVPDVLDFAGAEYLHTVLRTSELAVGAGQGNDARIVEWHDFVGEHGAAVKSQSSSSRVG